MKPYTYLLLSMLLYPLFTSCSKEEKTEEPVGPVTLSPRIAGISLTRAGISEAKDLKAIGFYAVGTNNTDGTYGTWPKGTYGKFGNQTSDGNTTFIPATADDHLWLDPGKSATIFSCHPAPANGASDIVDASTLNADGTANTPQTPSFPIPVISIPQTVINLSPSLPADGSTDFADPDNDYMYGVTYTASNDPDENTKYGSTQPIANGDRNTSAADINTKGPIVSIGLKHAFAQIRLIIKKGETYPGTATVSEVKYARAMRTLTANSKMKLTDGTFLGVTDATAYTYDLKSTTNSNGQAVSEGNDLTITNYALPCPAAASTISLTVDGKEMSIKYDDDPLWLEGKIYTYAVTINGTGLAFTGVSVVSWSDGANNDNNSSGTL